MLFQQSFWPGLADGSITMTFRRWKRAQVVVGRRYRSPAGFLEIDAIDEITEAQVSDRDARASGYPDAARLIAGLTPGADRTIFRIRFRRVDVPDARDELAHDDALSPEVRSDLDRRLDRLDRASSHGAWTRPVLQTIAERPGVRAADLAESFGRETQPFKTDVRKLKNLGLTISLEVGYRLSPRGAAYLAGR